MSFENCEMRSAFSPGHPARGTCARTSRDEPVNFWSVFSYMIVYDPATKPLGVARIVHGGQDLERLFRNHPPRV